MAITMQQFRDALRGVFGFHEDSGRTVENFVNKMTRTCVAFKNDEANATNTQPLITQVVFTAARAGKLMSARYVQSISSTVSASDFYVLRLIKYSASSYSVTASMGTLTANTAITNKPRASNAFTLDSTSANIEVATGDVIQLRGTKTLLGALVPQGVLVLEIE